MNLCLTHQRQAKSAKQQPMTARATDRDSATPNPRKAAKTRGAAKRQLAISEALLRALMNSTKPTVTSTAT